MGFTVEGNAPRAAAANKITRAGKSPDNDPEIRHRRWRGEADGFIEREALIASLLDKAEDITQKQIRDPQAGRLWLNDGSCIRLRPCWSNHVWSYDFVEDRTHDGRKIRMLTVIDEFTRRCLAIVVDRRLNSDNVLQCLTDLFTLHGPPDHIRSDNGTEFAATRSEAGSTG